MARPPQWKFLVLSRNTRLPSQQQRREAEGALREGRRPPTGSDPRKCVLTCTGQGPRLQWPRECSGGELAGVGQRGLGESDGGWLRSDLRQLGGGGGSPAALPAQQRSAHPVLPGPRSRCVCGLEHKQGGCRESVGGTCCPLHPASTRPHGDESPVVCGVTGHVPWGLSTVDLVLGPETSPL